MPAPAAPVHAGNPPAVGSAAPEVPAADVPAAPPTAETPTAASPGEWSSVPPAAAAEAPAPESPTARVPGAEVPTAEPPAARASDTGPAAADPLGGRAPASEPPAGGTSETSETTVLSAGSWRPPVEVPPGAAHTGAPSPAAPSLAASASTASSPVEASRTEVLSGAAVPTAAASPWAQDGPRGFVEGETTTLSGGTAGFAGPPPGQAPPPVVERVVDPPAAALGNASFLGVGYLQLGRSRLAVLTGLVTVVLLVVLAAFVRSVWLEVVVVLWWLALIAHGWRLAGGRARTPGPDARRQRLGALAAALPVLLVIGFLRLDAAVIEGDAEDALAAGDCGQAVTAVDRLWFGHRVVDAPLTGRGDDTVRTCRRLDSAAASLTKGLEGDTISIKNGFDDLTAVLAEKPDYGNVVNRVLDDFLGKLPTPDACDTRDITAWLRERGTKGNALDRAAEVAPRVAPPAILACADGLMTSRQFEQARARYQELVDVYPDHELAPKAKEGVQKATWEIELANVRQLLNTPSQDRPRYCDAPAQYSAAPAYGAQRPNRAWVAGKNEHTRRLPGDWLVDDVANATVVVCVGSVAHGSVKETCDYVPVDGSGGSTPVAFHRIAMPVRVYELKTGKLVSDTTVEINGASCPERLSYRTGDEYVAAADSDVHAAFSPFINP
ncbi:hypothetical protein [Saccharothrix violaceirubra]|uniref:Tetratricopeptide repeat protein n=1 Tax=Saccharothrix violaceirubra TaxID=413306 RepID=A0A7W7T517_9PSEU|nr:hypothetical protein [Saccharothrix violaceirubra]MBB4966713.1 hypothetical protein [Saccharothrix violaceirubra]